jgi:hypothetical protein
MTNSSVEHSVSGNAVSRSTRLVDQVRAYSNQNAKLDTVEVRKVRRADLGGTRRCLRISDAQFPQSTVQRRPADAQQRCRPSSVTVGSR